MERGGYDGREGRPRGVNNAPSGELPVRIEDITAGHAWTAQLDTAQHGSVIAYTPGMTLRWHIAFSGRRGPTVQLLGPPMPEEALRELRHAVDAWITTHPPEDA